MKKSVDTNPSPSEPAVKKGRVLELPITTAAFEGKGLGKINDFAIFVKNTAPGDLILTQIIKKRKQFAEGRLIDIIKPSDMRVPPLCTHSGVCGGCNWQHVSYEQELDFKKSHIEDHFTRIGGFKTIQVENTIGAEKPYYYRNKMEYTFGDRRWLTDEEIASADEIKNKDFALGLHIPGRFDRILNLDECHLQPSFSFDILDAVRTYAIKNHIEPYNPHKHVGFLRNLIIRNAVYTGDVMVNLVTSADSPNIRDPLFDHLTKMFPQITTTINTINDTRSPSSDGHSKMVLSGPGYIHERLGKYTFKIDPDTFFQTNTRQAETLYDTVVSALDSTADQTIFDLYCGVGTLSIYVSNKAKKVVGIELNPSAIEKARENARNNAIDHAVFEEGDMKDIFNDALINKHGKPDMIITDPPRAGMHEHVINQLRKLAPKRIVYVSCNSATQARDIALLTDMYDISRIQPVDMFPRTYHIESVALLNLR